MWNIYRTDLEEFNKEPVYYCPHCLSLRIKILNDYIDYCDDCGCTDIETTSIEEWEKKYKDRYNKNFIEHGRSKSE